MNPESNYIAINRESWNRRVDSHMRSAFYDVESFLNGRTSLNEIELQLFGDIAGKSVLHLQCHFGQDTISLSRLGATVTGVDLSDKAIDEARALAKKTRSDASFLCCDIYDLPAQLDTTFDIVFASYGTIGWLPDIDKWAKVVSRFLKPQGRFVFVEFHPVVWMFDDNFEKIDYSYFNTGAIAEVQEGTYADRAAEIRQECVTWNHPLGDVMGSLLRNGLTMERFEEYDYSPYDCFQQTVEVAPGRYRIGHLQGKIPMVYSIVARK